MSLTSISFVFIFLPASVVLYRIVPGIGRNALLLLLSVLFISWGNPADMVLIALSIVFNYFTALELAHLRRSGGTLMKRLVLGSGIAANLALLVFFKYVVFLLNNIGALTGIQFHLTLPQAPIGISFFTFSAISCLCDVAKGDEDAILNPLDFALYIAFFAKITSGPIVKFREMAGQIRQRSLSVQSLEEGFKLFITGLAKKVIIAGSLGTVYNAVKAVPLGSMSALTAWEGALACSLMLYFDFGGYSDMAIGLARIFGFSFSKNFDYPYTSVSMTDFWRRWHISLGSWFRDYVYIPLGGSRVSKKRNIFNLSVVWILTGLWHGANWTFVIWGLYHLGLLLLEKFVLRDITAKIPSLIRSVITFILAVIGWTVFFAEDVAYAALYLLRMAGIGGSGWSDRTGMYLLSGGWILLALAIAGSTPLFASAAKKISTLNKPAAEVIGTLFFALLLLGSTAFMISDTVSSFLYAQF